MTLRGVGLALRRAHFDALFDVPEEIDWLEICPENFLGYGGRVRDVLWRCRDRWRIAMHGVAASIGGPDPLDSEYCASLAALADELEAPLVTEHLSYSSIGGRQFLDLLPLPFTSECVKHVASRAREFQARLDRPVALENITYYALMPGAEMDEPTFVRAVLEEANLGLLLDLNNLYVNATNHRVDPEAWLVAMPLERVVQVHLAGHRRDRDVLVDDHGSAVDPAVLALYAKLIAIRGPLPTLLEWDHHIPPMATLVEELRRIREVHERGVRRAEAAA